MTVECSNCGPGPEAWAALILAALSFLVATVAVAYAKRSADRADQAVALATEEVAMARDEHEVWLKRMNARADLRLALRTIGADEDGVVRTEGSVGTVRVEVEVSNDGALAAKRTALKVLAPRGTRSFRWCGPNGEPVRDLVGPARLDEELTAPDGTR